MVYPYDMIEAIPTLEIETVHNREAVLALIKILETLISELQNTNTELFAALEKFANLTNGVTSR